jgi:hypothetical protein
MPDIKVSAFYRGKPGTVSTVPMLSSTGCPYGCEFCVDWNSVYATLPTEQLHSDLEFLSRHYPALLVAYHDPNFAVRFDRTMDVISRIPYGRRNGYIMETSLSILKPERLSRLRETNCIYVAPGVESWIEYSGKAGTGADIGPAKLRKVLEKFNLLSSYVPGVQANFMFGADGDAGEDPITLTKEFIHQTPKVWPTINIPTPYGGTPLYDQLHRANRLLQEMPFLFYYNPYLAITIKNYDPATFYDHLIDLNLARASAAMLFRRFMTSAPRMIRFLNGLRVLSTQVELRELRRIRATLKSDAQFRAYHEGRSRSLPVFYKHLFERRLGRYAELLPPSARQPILEPPAPKLSAATPARATIA